MRVGIITFSQIATFLIVLSLGLPISSEAGVFWAEDFEHHLTPNWDTSACGGSQQDGCNPGISTTLATSGNHSLHSSYHCPDGLNSPTGGCGTYVVRFHPNSQDVYMRWNMNLQNFTVNPLAGSKLMYNKCCSGNNFLTFWHMFPGQNYVSAQVIPDSNAANFQFFCPSLGRNDQGCNYYPNVAAININDNQWHCIETHVGTGTPGTQTGIIEIWVDGRLSMSYPNIWVAHYTGGLFNEITHYAQLGDGDRYIDDLVVGSSRIGCTGNPSADTTPPVAPLGLAIR